MKETLKERFGELVKAMGNSKGSYEQEFPRVRGSVQVDKDNPSCYIVEGYPWRKMVSVSTINDQLRVAGTFRDPYICARVTYGFDENGNGKAEEARIFNGGVTDNIMPFDFDLPEQRLSTMPSNDHKDTTITFATIEGDPTHRNTEATYSTLEETKSGLAVFGRLPVRDVTIQMLYDWMQRTFPHQLKTVDVKQVADLQKLKEKYAPIFGFLEPSEHTLDFVAKKESAGWELIQVYQSDMRNLAYHRMLEEGRGKENVFHYQLDAKVGRQTVTVDLYFVRKKQS